MHASGINERVNITRMVNNDMLEPRMVSGDMGRLHIKISGQFLLLSGRLRLNVVNNH